MFGRCRFTHEDSSVFLRSEQCKCQRVKRVEVHGKLEDMAERRRKRSREEERTGRAGH